MHDTLALPRLGRNASADRMRKQQVLGSNPSVGYLLRTIEPIRIWMGLAS
jgi:hypothetical protein